MYGPVIIHTPAFPHRRVLDLPEHYFPIDDETAGELLILASTPLDIDFHPRRLFSRMRLLAHTATTKIYLATTHHHEEMVVKKLKIRDSPVLQSYVEIEVAMSLLCSNCSHVVTFHGVMRTTKNIWLIMEHMSVGSLARLRSCLIFSEKAIAYVLKQVLTALVYMHHRNRVHRDIKAHNILVNSACEVKLMDFGWTAQLTQGHPTTCLAVGSIFWMAPEVHAGQAYGVEADIWSLGILMYELAYLEPPHYSLDHDSASIVIMLGDPPTFHPETNWSPQFLSFSRACLQKVPQMRLTAQQLLLHPFMGYAYTDEEWVAMLHSEFPRWPHLPRS